jgi:hypothetical protein
MLAAAQVVDAIAALVVSAGTPASGRVYTSRAWPVETLPAWRVTAEEEAIEQLTLGDPAINDHQLTVRLQGLCEAVAGLDDALHVMTAAACLEVFQSTNLEGLNATVSLRRIERRQQAEGQSNIGEVGIELVANFQTLANAPETIL